MTADDLDYALRVDAFQQRVAARRVDTIVKTQVAPRLRWLLGRPGQSGGPGLPARAPGPPPSPAPRPPGHRSASGHAAISLRSIPAATRTSAVAVRPLVRASDSRQQPRSIPPARAPPADTRSSAGAWA